VCVCVLCKTCS